MPSIPGGEGQRKTIGVEFYPKMIEILDKRVKLQLWDISSESQWRSYIQRYCKGANGAFIVYDKSERDSYETAKELYKELKEATDLKSRIKGGSRMIIDMPVILIGLGDGDNVIAGEGQSLAKEWGAYGYIEMEDTDSINFENALSTLALGVITNHQNALKKSPRRYRFKITVVGNVEVGKTSLIKQFTKGSFQTDYVKTIGAQYSVISIEIERNKVNCLFWDIAGGEGFHFLHPSFFKNSLAAIIVYSLGEDDSLNQISKWHDEIINECGDIPIIIIGNKSDLVDESKLDISRIQDYVTKYDLLGHFITSAKTGQGIKAAFNKIIEELYNKIK
jgi:Ras-related protein Rab-6A